MARLTIEELRKRADELRKRVDALAAQHAKTAGFSIGADEPLEQVTIAELTEECRAETLGGIEIEELERVKSALSQFTVTASGDEDLDLKMADARSQLEKGQAVADDVTRVLRDAWRMEHKLRAEVDELVESSTTEGKSASYAAEQKRLLLEKLLLLLLIAGLLEAAKRCLLMVIRLLTLAYTILAMAAQALYGASMALGNTVFQQIQAAPPAPPPPGAPPFGVLPGQNGVILSPQAQNAIGNALQRMAQAQAAARNAARIANALVAAAMGLLPHCLALQRLAYLLAEALVDSQQGMGGEGGPDGDGGGVQP